jgi:hypothetical protein
MLAKTVAWLLVVLCVVPTTAPFAVRSRLLGSGHSVAASVGNDDDVVLERSAILNGCWAWTCVPATRAVVTNLSTPLLQELPAAGPPVRPPALRFVLRV